MLGYARSSFSICKSSGLFKHVKPVLISLFHNQWQLIYGLYVYTRYHSHHAYFIPVLLFLSPLGQVSLPYPLLSHQPGVLRRCTFLSSAFLAARQGAHGCYCPFRGTQSDGSEIDLKSWIKWKLVTDLQICCFFKCYHQCVFFEWTHISWFWKGCLTVDCGLRGWVWG